MRGGFFFNWRAGTIIKFFCYQAQDALKSHKERIFSITNKFEMDN